MKTLELYCRLIGVRIRSQLQYRVSFGLDLFTQTWGNAIYFLTLALVMQKFQTIAGWNLGDLAFLYGMVEISFGLMDMIFAGFDPQGFGQYVRTGRFDQMLLRPVNLVVQVLGSDFILRRLGRVFQGGIVLWLALQWTWPHWTPQKLLYLPVVVVSMMFFFGGLFMLGSGITFWTIEAIEAINIFTYGGTEMMAYPMEIYPGWMRQLFTYVLPGIFLSYAPAVYFLDKPNFLGLPLWSAYASPLVGLGMLGMGMVFWRFGVRYYQSTGS